MRKKIRLATSLALVLFSGLGFSQKSSGDTDPATHTKTGAPMPSFTVTDSNGHRFSLADQRGKVVLVNFWATWCPPCRIEIPRLESEIWQQHKSDPNFAMIAIAREQTNADIVPFAKTVHFTYPIAGDPGRATYAHFADSGIPRSYLVSPDGKILYQIEGYNPEEFDHLKQELNAQLAKLHK